jgi:hypothetical protein
MQMFCGDLLFKETSGLPVGRTCARINSHAKLKKFLICEKEKNS